MGAWGPAIFSDDTACDIRSDYREMLEDGVDDAEAMQRVITEYQHLADDERHVLWLALAAAQVAVGRLDATVKTEALRIIDEGIGLDLWVEAGPKALASRKAALAKLRNALTSKQKARTKVRKPWVHVTDLVPGDVLAYRRHPDGRYALFRVARIEGGRLGAAPILRQLKWDKASLPPGWRLRRLQTLAETKAGGPEPSTSFRRRRGPTCDDSCAPRGRGVESAQPGHHPEYLEKGDTQCPQDEVSSPQPSSPRWRSERFPQAPMIPTTAAITRRREAGALTCTART